MAASLIPDQHATVDEPEPRAPVESRVTLVKIEFSVVAALAGGYRESRGRSDFCIRVKIDLVGLGGTLARNPGSVKQEKLHAQLRQSNQKVVSWPVTNIVGATVEPGGVLELSLPEVQIGS